MKKAILIMAALVVIGSLAFADFTTGMWGRTQFDIVGGSNWHSDILTGWDGATAGGLWPPKPRENLNWGFSSDKMAFNFTAYFDSTEMTMTNMYGTLKVAPDMATILIGEFKGDGWDTFRKTSPHPIHDLNNGNVGRFSGYGVIADIAPKGTGFETAVMIRTDVTTGNVGAASTTPQFKTTDVLLNTDIAAAYTVPNMIKVTLGSTVDGKLAPTAETPVRDIFGRIEALMVPNLTAWLDVKYTGLEKINGVDPDQVINTELAGAYNMDALSIVLAAALGVDAPKTGDSTIAWEVRPEVYYNLGAITAGLYLDVIGSSVKDSTIAFTAEPYVKINDFNTRIALSITSSTTNDVVKDAELTWSIPVLIDFGF
jgi:hypothetical protein